MIDPSTLRFDDRGLIPVVVQDANTGAVLMLAWANREAVDLTLSTGEAHFWSRSRQEYWCKGETSGDRQFVREAYYDCDGDTLLFVVDQEGKGACHTGERTCFGDGAGAAVAALGRLDRTLASRAAARPEGSYTVRLLDDQNLRLKKLGEETAELVAALAVADGGKAVEEAADLVYHLLVALRACGLDVTPLLEELDRRA